jgi:hypothetical protein
MRYAALIILMAFLLVSCPVFADKGVSKEDMFEKHLNLESPSGLKARFFQFSGKGNGKTFIEKKDVIIATIDNAMPIAWHPTEDILIVKEYRGNDDDKCYILNIAKGEYAKNPADRSAYILGDPYCNRAKWSKDGEKFTLYSTFGSKEYTYNLADLIPVENKDNK